MSKFEGPKSAVDRFVGGDADAQAQVEGYFAEAFANQEIPECQGLERPPIPEELAIFAVANRVTSHVLQRYGISDFDVPTGNIHVIPEANWREFSERQEMPQQVRGLHDPQAQAIFLKEDESALVLAKSTIHEMLHFKVFQSFNVVIDDDAGASEIGIETRRQGLEVRTRERALAFHLLNEAVTVELEKRALAEARLDPAFKEEIEYVEGFLQRHPECRNDDLISLRHMTEKEKLENPGYNFHFERVSYPRPRAVLNKLIDALYELNQGDYRNREEVFDLFGRAAVTGRMLELGRVIEKTFGPGTFRQLGECQTEADLEEFAKEIKS